MPAMVLAALMMLAQAAPLDGRIKQVRYQSDDVVTLAVAPGYAAVVELAPEEAILNVVVGNSSAWQVTPNSAADRIIVKPLAEASTTNMIVVTDVRRYIFLLDANGGDQGTFVLKFSYPDAPAPVAAASTSVATYRLSGTKALFPAAMYDDGHRTTITWSDQTSLPAVFAMAEGGTEAIVNGRMVGSDFVVEGTSSRYVFRLGDARAVASRRIVKAKP